MMLRSHFLTMVLASAALNSSPAASLFTDRDLFFEQNTRLATENFSGPTNSISFFGPLDASTGNAEINPGNIVEGLSVDTDPAFGKNLFLGVPPAGGRLANTIGNNNHSATLQFDFDELAATACGLDLYGFFGTANIVVDIYSPTGLLCTSIVNIGSAANPSFLGVVTESNTVSRVELSREDLSFFINVYEIHFGPSRMIGDSAPTMTRVSAGPTQHTVVVRWTSEEGPTYTLDWATASTGDAYVVITNGLAATPPLNNVIVDTLNIPYASFRVRAQVIP